MRAFTLCGKPKIQLSFQILKYEKAEAPEESGGKSKAILVDSIYRTTRIFRF
jgi:hypothetical protein